MRRSLVALISMLLAWTMVSCGSTDPVGNNSSSGSITIGSQQYYSNEIIAELYAQVLAAESYQIDRQYQIGQREVYLPEMEAGRIDLLPEYSGNLLQYFDAKSDAKTAQEVTAALAGVLPAGLRVLDAAPATDQDSYTVTRATAEQYGLSSIGDLAKLPQPVTVGANSELATRPYGIPGLQQVYGVQASLVPIEDSGSALTVKALTDGTVQVADIYTASPAIKTNDLVSLDDPQALILPQNITPLVSSAIDEQAAQAINKVTAQLTTAELIGLNDRSITEQLPAAQIATDWLKQKGLI